jgi:predicted enzyme related to lactoylglutathione lyase
MAVVETFFSVEVRDMGRAVTFYRTALQAEAVFSSPGWVSLRIAGVRVALALVPDQAPARTGLHFQVTDLAEAGAAVEAAGGQVQAAVEVAPGVVTCPARDSEGNSFTLGQR